MLKNQKSTIALVIIALVFIVMAGFFIVKILTKDNMQVQASSQLPTDTIALDPRMTNDSISLSPKPTDSDQGGSAGLSVDDSKSTSTNLGSGIRQQTTTVAGASTQEDFSKYEEYQDKNEVYFGDIVVGTGAEAVKDAQLAVTYVGYLTTGQVFDQSRKGNNGQLQPLLFTLGSGQLIPGFEQGVAGMKVGGTRRIIIPPSLGYGANAQGSIPANSVLVFDIQLTAAQ